MSKQSVGTAREGGGPPGEGVGPPNEGNVSGEGFMWQNLYGAGEGHCFVGCVLNQ